MLREAATATRAAPFGRDWAALVRVCVEEGVQIDPDLKSKEAVQVRRGIRNLAIARRGSFKFRSLQLSASRRDCSRIFFYLVSSNPPIARARDAM